MNRPHTLLKNTDKVTPKRRKRQATWKLAKRIDDAADKMWAFALGITADQFIIESFVETVIEGGHDPATR